MEELAASVRSSASRPSWPPAAPARRWCWPSAAAPSRGEAVAAIGTHRADLAANHRHHLGHRRDRLPDQSARARTPPSRPRAPAMPAGLRRRRVRGARAGAAFQRRGQGHQRPAGDLGRRGGGRRQARPIGRPVARPTFSPPRSGSRPRSQEIAAASGEQATGIEEVSRTTEHLDETTQRNAALAEQSLGTARELSQQMGELRTLMDGFATNVDRSARAGAPIRLSQASPVTPLRRAS